MELWNIFRKVKYKVWDIQCAAEIAVDSVINATSNAALSVGQTISDITWSIQYTFKNVDWEPVCELLKEGGKKTFDFLVVVLQQQAKQIEQNKEEINQKIKYSNDKELLQLAVNHTNVYVRDTATKELEERGKQAELESERDKFNSSLKKIRLADKEELKKFIKSGSNQYLSILAIEELKKREEDC